MKLIAHRGNIYGKNPQKENKIEYILQAIESGYDVEIDVRFIDSKWYLGHDLRGEEIQKDFLQHPNIWVHCKNLKALEQLQGSKKINYFWHQKDEATLTSFGFIWAYPGKQPILNSIAVLPEIYNDDLSVCWGICSDIVGEYKK